MLRSHLARATKKRDHGRTEGIINTNHGEDGEGLETSQLSAANGEPSVMET
jgi:hypothetical protein